MPQAITGILPLIMGGTAGAGLIGNIMSSIQQGKVASQAEKNANLTPAQLGRKLPEREKPLSQDLRNSITNSVQGDMASRGLAEAPGIFAASEGQAEAPFLQAEQDRAIQLVLAKLGLPAETLAALRSGGGGNANLSPLLQMLMKQFPKSAAPTNPSTVQATPPFIQTQQDPGITFSGGFGPGDTP